MLTQNPPSVPAIQTQSPSVALTHAVEVNVNEHVAKAAMHAVGDVTRLLTQKLAQALHAVSE